MNLKVKDHGSSKLILIVDDSTDLLILYKAIFESDSFRVITATSGNEALAVLNGTQEPDLILLDVNMQGMSGLELLVILEEKYLDLLEKVPIVFLTAAESVPDSRAVSYVRKDKGIYKLLEVVHRLLDSNEI